MAGLLLRAFAVGLAGAFFAVLLAGFLVEVAVLVSALAFGLDFGVALGFGAGLGFDLVLADSAALTRLLRAARRSS